MLSSPALAYLMSESPLLVVIAGCHASGKKTSSVLLQQELYHRFSGLKVKLINMMDYYTFNDNTKDSKTPDQFDFRTIKHQMSYNESKADVVILFGLYALFDPEIRKMASISVFIDCDADVRLGRWIKRDVLCLSKEEQSKSLEAVMDVYLHHARQEMKNYIIDTKEYADLILPRGADKTGIAIIADGLQPMIIGRLNHEDSASSSKTTFNSPFMDDKLTSGSSLAKENSVYTPRLQSSEPSVLSLSNDNFTNQNKRFYDIN